MPRQWRSSRRPLTRRTSTLSWSALNTDVLNNNDLQAFADLVSLGQTMLQEAEVTTAYGLPSRDALLGYSQIVNDLVNVGAMKEITYAFVNYLASKLPTPYTGSTPSYLASGTLGNAPSSGSVGGLLSQTNQAALTGYSPSSLSASDFLIQHRHFGGPPIG